jgi:hypothetical protein
MHVLTALESTGFATWLRESGSIWAYPAILTLHTTGMGVLVGANWTLDLRVLGVGAGVPLAPLEKLYRAMWFGFWVNLITGVMLFAADATTKGTTTIFFVKIGLIVTAVIVAIVMRRVVYPRGAQPGVPPLARALAALSIVLWVGGIVTGRWMGYIYQ